MTVKTATDPKDPSTATEAPNHGCCGDEARAESRTDKSKHVNHDHHESAVQSIAVKSSCCCGTKDSGPAS